MNNAQCVVYIIGNDPDLSAGLHLLLLEEGIPVYTFENAQAFLDICTPECCGCVIVDAQMPGMDGLALQQELPERGIILPMIFVAVEAHAPTIVKAIRAGALDFLIKPITHDQILPAILNAIQVEERILTQVANGRHARDLVNNLTEREREVMALAVDGLPNKEIARRLDISFRTVEIHKAHIMQKTGASNLLDLARLAQEAGLKRVWVLPERRRTTRTP